MKRKILYSLVVLIFVLIFIISVIFIKVIKQSQEVIARLRKEREPEKVEVSEITLKNRKGWELFVNKADVRDIALLNRNYYLATTGGIIILSENGTILKEFNTNWGLPENSILQLLKREDGILALTEGGKLIDLRENLFFSYNLKKMGKVLGISEREEDVLISALNGVYLLSEDEVGKIEDIKDAKITKPFSDGIVVGTIRGKVYISTATFKDSILDIDAVNDIKEKDEVIYIATPLGLKKITREEVKLELTGEFIMTITEYDEKICCGTFDGRVIIGKTIDRVAKKETCINRLRVLNNKLFALTSEGVYLLEDGKWSVFYRPSGDIPLNYITSLLKTGIQLIIGTFEDGCFSLKSNRLHRLNIEKGVNEINQIVSAGNALFIASNSGLFLLDQRGVKKIEGLPSHFVSSVLIRGKKLIAGTSRGFGLMDLVHFNIKNFGSFQGLINNRVYALAHSEDKIILGTLGGISVFDGKSFKNFTSANSALKSNWINGLIDTGSRIYIGTYGGGISYLDKEDIKSIEETKGVEVNHNGLFYKKPYLFACTCKNGLFVYNEKENKGKFLRGLFPLDDVTAIYVDDEYFYIGTEQGLYKIESKEMPL
ncbi:hypothetical protein KAW96_06650 [candidate division WOR-3 bacterium]|nr:hypothetical protein [candidate division WOR-3 bacterium]